MKFKAAVLAVLMVFLLTAVALAVSPAKEIVFDKSPMGKVTFSGKVHAEAGFKCNDCHNESMFPKMKQGTVSIKMAKIYSGQLCGKCHDGQTAFKAMGNCNRCHKK